MRRSLKGSPISPRYAKHGAHCYTHPSETTHRGTKGSNDYAAYSIYLLNINLGPLALAMPKMSRIYQVGASVANGLNVTETEGSDPEEATRFEEPISPCQMTTFKTRLGFLGELSVHRAGTA